MPNENPIFFIDRRVIYVVCMYLTDYRIFGHELSILLNNQDHRVMFNRQF